MTITQPCVPEVPGPSQTPYRIYTKGCYLVAAAQLIGYFGAVVDPPTLNTWLRQHGGYTAAGDVDPLALASYATGRGVPLGYQGAGTGSDLPGDICFLGPQLIRPGNGHWATAVGFPDELSDTSKPSDALMNDPNGGHVSPYSAYANWPGHVSLPSAPTRVFFGPGHGPITLSGILVEVQSPATLLVTDPRGRKLGFDAASGRYYADIPRASYDDTGLADPGLVDPFLQQPDPDPAKTATIPQPLEGDYVFDVVGQPNANGRTYSLEVRAYDTNGGRNTLNIRDRATGAGQKESFSLTYSSQVGSPLKFSGGFDGGGQRPRDVNRFLTYVRPASSSVDLPAGTTSYAVNIYYGAAILPWTFAATLNGLDVAPRFHPEPNTSEVVTLDLQTGSNVLKLSIDGTLGSRTATDSDRFVFKIP